jgi:hypothetical protein
MASVQERRLIGPSEAAELLELNRGNRKIDQAKVHKYARQMREGRWLDTGIPIILLRQGQHKHLEDGQHRLLAIIESGVDLMLTISVVTEPVFGVVDSGKVRSLGDLIAIKDGSTEGVTAKRSAAVGIAVDLWMRGRSLTMEYQQYTTEERMELLEEYPREASFLKEIIGQHKRFTRKQGQSGRLPHAGFLAGALEIQRVDAEAQRFFDGVFALEEGEPLRPLSAALWLHDQIKDPPEVIHGQFPEIARSWNNWVVLSWVRRGESSVRGIVSPPRQWLSAGGQRVVAEAPPAVPLPAFDEPDAENRVGGLTHRVRREEEA